MNPEQIKAISVKLSRSRGSVKAKLTALEKYLQEFNSETGDVFELKLRYKVIDQIHDEYQLVHSQLGDYLELEDDEVAKEYSAKLLEFFEQYCKVKGAYESKIHQLEGDANSEGSVSTIRDNSIPRMGQFERSAPRLPTIALPTFSGLFRDWTTFRDNFNGLVNSRNDLTKVLKFHYLLEGLGKDPNGPRRTVDKIEVTDDGFDLAMAALKDRYENNRLIIEDHISEIFKLKFVKEENASDLRVLVEEVVKHLRALKKLGEPVEKWDSLLVCLVCFRLDTDTRKHWETHLAGKKVMPKWQELEDFLQSRCRVLESLEFNQRRSNNSNRQRLNNKQSFISTSNEERCAVCNSSHSTAECNKYLELKIPERQETLKKRGLCYRCLKRGHLASNCEANCDKCKGNHHHTIHVNKDDGNQDNRNKENPETTANFGKNDTEQILLMTAKVKVKSSDGKWIEARALLDSGSQSNFCSMNLCKKLQLKPKTTSIVVNGIAGSVGQILKKVQTEIESNNSDFRTDVELLVVGKLAERMPSKRIQLNESRVPAYIKNNLADPDFMNPQEVDLLLGIDVFITTIEMEMKSIGPEFPVFQRTKFGWIASGKIDTPSHQSSRNVFSYLNTTEIHDEIKKFWELEEPKNANVWTIEEKACEKHFVENFKRGENGQYIVRIPFKPEELKFLGESKKIAKKRFESTEKRLGKSSELRSQYVEFMREYKILGHMTQIEEPANSNEIYVMPHHPVLKPESTTTKCRVVFNASEKTTSGRSLNDTQMIGPTVQDNLFNIVIRERKHTIALTADVEKMYRMVKIHEDDRKYQVIIWRENPQEKLEYYMLNTVTYGTSSAPFLSTRVLQQLAIDEKEKFPLASQAINDFYVDDYIGGASTIEEAKELQLQLIGMFKGAGMNLRKWNSNQMSDLNHSLDEGEDVEKNSDDSSINRAIKTLGLTWYPAEDCYGFKIADEVQQQVATKRQLLSRILKLFDPIGFLSPVIVTARLMMQELWLLNCTWDDKLPELIVTRWEAYATELQNISSIKINRCVIPSTPSRIELHGFCDASEKAYGACCYVRMLDSTGRIIVNLLCSKFRVAPLKKRSLPQLELCGAVLLSKLIVQIIAALQLNFDEIYCWTDSTIVLNWIEMPGYKLKTFVANRVSEIQEATSNFKWNHVSTKMNPADLPSRGISVAELKNSELWWSGPEFLQQSIDLWPKLKTRMEPDKLPDVKTETEVYVTTIKLNEIVQNHSSVTKFKRYVAYWMRYINNRITQGKPKLFGPLSQFELQQALKAIVRWDQRQQFSQEYSRLIKNQEINENSSIKSLNPFLDEEGILRVGGRLQSSKLQYDGKHQMLLSKQSEFTKKLIVESHREFGHAGPQTLLSILRRQFWPVHGKQMIRTLLKDCVVCAKMNPRKIDQFMGNLPRERVELVHPFFATGVDFAGPFSIKEGGIRSKKYFKSWVAVFVCMATKCVHLELVQDLSTQSFLQALTRFVSRRGRPSSMHSDNATNFVGANNELKELHHFINEQETQVKIDRFCSDNGIQWHFIPPRSPSFGGKWEAEVKNFKYHFVRIAGQAHLTVLEMETILCKIEAILNSRPLFPESSDPNDFTAITPGHFLIGRPLVSVVEADWTDVNVNRLARYERIQQVAQHFWKRFHDDYLNNLQVRLKSYKESIPFKEGQLVMLREENVKPLNWKMARVVQLHPGKDGITRVITVKTKDGLYRRAVNRVSPLPIETEMFQGAQDVEIPLGTSDHAVELPTHTSTSQFHSV